MLIGISARPPPKSSHVIIRTIKLGELVTVHFLDRSCAGSLNVLHGTDRLKSFQNTTVSSVS